jgi:hypothetical protein
MTVDAFRQITRLFNTKKEMYCSLGLPSTSSIQTENSKYTSFLKGKTTLILRGFNAL